MTQVAADAYRTVGPADNGPATEALNLYEVQETRGSMQIRA